MAQKIDQRVTAAVTPLDEFMQNDLRAAGLMAIGSRVSEIQEEIEQTKLEIRAAQHVSNDHAALELFEQLEYWIEELNLTLTVWAEG